MNNKLTKNNNKLKVNFSPSGYRKHLRKDMNLHIVKYLKNHLGTAKLKNSTMSNALNLKIKDIEDIEVGKRELSLKDIGILCKCYKIDPDNLFKDYLK